MTLRNRVTGTPCDPYFTPRSAERLPIHTTRSVRRPAASFSSLTLTSAAVVQERPSGKRAAAWHDLPDGICPTQGDGALWRAIKYVKQASETE